MKKIIFFFLTVCTFLVFQSKLQAWPQATEQSGSESRPILATQNLKEFMAHFGVTLSGLELMHAKEEKPDWEAIAISVKALDKNLKEMQAANKVKAYEEYLKTLSQKVEILKSQSAKKDPAIFKTIDETSNTCFRCHAAHRPADFYPSKTQPISEKRLFQN